LAGNVHLLGERLTSTRKRREGREKRGSGRGAEGTNNRVRGESLGRTAMIPEEEKGDTWEKEDKRGTKGEGTSTKTPKKF